MQTVMFKQNGHYLVLDLVARIITERERQQLEPQALRDFADVIITDPFGRQHPQDSDRWLTLLEDAMRQDYMLYCILLVTRFAGTRIADGGAYWRLAPIWQDEVAESWWTKEKWEAYRREVLMHFAEPMRDLMLKKGK